ncbi:heme ABC exporter ATP-binding protein CcmA [Sphingomonas aracearum]|uniref:Heme ABC exporter ATP-binding protein CcmA n=2 Tax=Sphingomonas aracearum TaxID=2283317 RepID=A0A369VRJ2_9SPHN|nr:heme ABC exporter ATP-binding protein CcmA [Sphingomonas aracearum]
MLFAGVSLALGPGEAALVTGPNGAGKSTLVRICAGLLAPAMGTVRSEGRIALLAEAHALDPELPLARALDFWSALDGGGPQAVASALAAVELAPVAQLPVRLLSTGQRRRAAFARVIASDAPIWLLDEPANGLDAAAIARLEHLLAVHRAAGGIVLAATHLPIALPGAVPVEVGR